MAALVRAQSGLPSELAPRQAVLCSLLLVGVAGCQLLNSPPVSDRPASLQSPTSVPSPETSGYAKALHPISIQLKRDMGLHPEFRAEWWYHTGHLRSSQGRRFAYELSLARYSQSDDKTAAQSSSAWATRQAYLGMFCLTDLDLGKFYCYERHARAAMGLAGVQSHPLRIWVDSWSATSQADAGDSWRLQAENQGNSINFQLAKGRGPLLHGDRGLSLKSDRPGNASYYFSLSRIPTRGTIVLDGERFEVEGQSWLDREWMTSKLEEHQAGWDWISVNLSDGRDLVCYQIRHHDGTVDSHSAGILVEPDGRQISLSASDFQLIPSQYWKSQADKSEIVEYPLTWKVVVKSAGIELEVKAAVADQEKRLSMRYWEGASMATGSSRGKSVEGTGFLEMTGYK